MAEDLMKEFRLQLSQLDGIGSELQTLLGYVDLEDIDQEEKLQDILFALEDIITDIQKTQGWI